MKVKDFLNVYDSESKIHIAVPSNGTLHTYQEKISVDEFLLEKEITFICPNWIDGELNVTLHIKD